MRVLLGTAIGFVIQFSVIFCMGSLFMYMLKMKKDSVMALIMGYLVYFTLFEIVTVPMTLALVPLKVLSVVWAILLIIIAICSMLLLHKQWREQLTAFLKNYKRIAQEHAGWIFFALAAIVLQCLIVLLYQDSTQDAAYYVGTVSTSVYTNTLGRYNPFTGQALDVFSARYIFSAYPMNNAVWCVLAGIPAMIQCKIIISILNMLVINAIVWQTGKFLFQGSRKHADFFVFLVFMLNLFTGTIYSSGTFLMTRFYEGKALLGNLSIPAAFLAATMLFYNWKKPTKNSELLVPEKSIWLLFFFITASALCFSGSAIIFPAVISAGVLPLIILNKRWRGIIPYCLCMLPCVAYGMIFMAVRLNLLSLSAK